MKDSNVVGEKTSVEVEKEWFRGLLSRAKTVQQGLGDPFFKDQSLAGLIGYIQSAKYILGEDHA